MKANNEDPDEIYLALIGDCDGECGKNCAKPNTLIFSVEGPILFRTEQIKTAEGMEGQRIGPDGPEGKVQKLLIMNRGLKSERLFIVRDVIREPTEIDAICRISNMVGG
jgi:hypothetical protein